MRVLMITPDLAANGVGRAYSLWLCFEELGWSCDVAGPSGGPVWRPLRSSRFAERCHRLEPGADGRARLRQLAERADVVVAVKLLPESFREALRLRGRVFRPLVLDIDDCDLEVSLDALSRRARLGLVHPRHVLTGRHPYQLRRLRRRAAAVPVMTSNPVLQARYGGELVPHVRRPGPRPNPHSRERPVVAFVGTPLPHKGLEVLRAALRHVAERGHTLTVTATAAGPVPPWEHWVGETSLEEGMRIVAGADIVALPSLDQGYAPAQVPVKLIDAMHAGRAVVASDLPPVRWALGDAGLLVPAGSVGQLSAALVKLADPEVRARLGQAARSRALERFVPGAVSPVVAKVVAAAHHAHSAETGASAEVGVEH